MVFWRSQEIRQSKDGQMAVRKRRNRFEFLTKKFPKRMQEKLVLVFMVVILAFIALVGKITYINASKGSGYTKIVLAQQQYDSRVIPYKRGDIVDCNGTKMATSERVYNVILDVLVMQSEEKKYEEDTIKILTECFGIAEETIRQVIEERPESQYEVLAKEISYEKAQEFKALKEDTKRYPHVKGVWLEEDYRRNYPYRTLASNVVGFSVNGNEGIIGIESAYDEILNGTDGREYGYFNEDASLERTVKAAKNGNTVVSTIDVTLQSMVEQCILEFNQAHAGEVRPGEQGSDHTAVIMMNPNTGEILAEASYPNFDLNNPRDLSFLYSEETWSGMTEEQKLDAMNQVWRNFCVSDAYEPGSTMKPFTVAAGLETGTLSGEEGYMCGGMLHVGDYDIYCHLKTGHGPVSVQDCVAYSCNVGLMHMAESIGVENFIRYQHVFGFGEYTGIDLPGEAYTRELLYTAENMKDVDLATCSFGQSFNVTMTQMAAAFCSLVNGGYYYEPHVVKQIQDEDGKVIETKDPVMLRKTVSAETSEKLKPYLRAVMEYGTGKPAAVPGYDIGAKTGTAEKLPRGNEQYLLSFIGCAPLENPEVVLYVVIDRPNVADQSLSQYVLELSRKIMEQTFPYLNISMAEAADPGGAQAEPEVTEPISEEYVDYGMDYADPYAYEDGPYLDEEYTPDLDSWATGIPAE